MKFRSLFAAALLVVAVPSMASVIVSTDNLGALSVPGIAGIGNDFSSAGTYQDNYNFTIGQAATAGGLILELDLSSKLDIDVTEVKLTSTGGGIFAPDFSPTLYNFGTLGAGSYTLSIFSTVTLDSTRGSGSVGYAGLLTLGSVRGGGSTSVPEPGMLALFGIGLVGVALTMRRRGAAVRS